MPQQQIVSAQIVGGGGGGGDVATDVIWDAKGDLAVGTGADTAARLAAGTNTFVLTADSTQTTGLKWAAGGAAITIAELDGAPSGQPGTLKFPNTTLTDNGDGSYTYAAAADSSKAPIGSPTFTGTTTAPEFSASGLTGATAASRYVGATTSGAPVSGTFAVGDFVIDQTGKVWICTTGGTPGTWAQVGSGGGGGTVLLASSILGAPAASVTLTLAAGTYGDLMLSYDARSADVADNAVINLRFNGDSGANYDDHWFYDNSTTTTVSPTVDVGATSASLGFVTAASAVANVSANGHIVVPNFQGTTFQKQYQSNSGMKDSNSSSRFFNTKATGWWRSAAAITSVTFLLDTGGNFIAGSAFRAWGL